MTGFILKTDSRRIRRGRAIKEYKSSTGEKGIQDLLILGSLSLITYLEFLSPESLILHVLSILRGCWIGGPRNPRKLRFTGIDIPSQASAGSTFRLTRPL